MKKIYICRFNPIIQQVGTCHELVDWINIWTINKYVLKNNQVSFYSTDSCGLPPSNTHSTIGLKHTFLATTHLLVDYH